jgi:hypothetical protein
MKGHLQTRTERKKKLYKLIVALKDIVAARHACAMFGQMVDSVGNDLYQPLLHAVVICYSKPFVENKGLGPLPGRWRKFANPDWQHSHDQLLEMRHKLIAHNDLDTVTVQIIPPGVGFYGPPKEGRLGVSWAVRDIALAPETFRTIWHTIEDLRIRLMKAIEEEMLVLYGLSKLPSEPFLLAFDEGV